MSNSITWVGMDVHKESIVVTAVRHDSDKATARFEIPNTDTGVHRLVKRLREMGDVRCAYEAGPCGYELRRFLSSRNISCDVVAPSLIPRKPGDRVKTDRRDAEKLARLHRMGELTAIRVPTPAQEALRDLVRTREDAKEDALRRRQPLLKFLLRQGRRYEGKSWTQAHWTWIRSQKFADDKAQTVLTEYLVALEQELERIQRLNTKIEEESRRPEIASTVARLRTLRGVDTVTAMTLVSELVDFSRFATAHELMSFAGLVPSEYSSGGKEFRLSLGRVDELRASGELDRMAEALVRLTERQKIVDLAKELVAPAAKMLGPVLVFRCLWKRLGLPRAIADSVEKETFVAYDMEAATFRMVLGRLLDPKSKLATHRWATKVYWDDGENVDLQHYYRALGVLARNVKRMEENLYFAGRDLFTPAPDLLFFDTTSVYFEGEGPTGGLGQYYYSKDNRPDRKQMIVGVVMTREGEPLAHHVFPGNTPDAAAFSVVIEEMRNRFGIRRVILVGDRGMFNTTIIRRIEELEMEYIAGVRMRTVVDVREIVLADKAPFETVSENLKVKKVELGGKTYVVCLNDEEARRAQAVREQVVAELREKIARGPKRLVGHSLNRKYVHLDKNAVSVNEQKIIDEKKYDGKYILLTNTNLSAKETALAYKGLWQVERAFREIKSTFEIRPVYLSREDHVRGHVAICFFAFCLQVAFRKAIKDIEELADHSFESLLESLKELLMVELSTGDKSYRVRTEPDKVATAIFRAVGAAIPRRVTMLESQQKAAQA